MDVEDALAGGGTAVVDDPVSAGHSELLRDLRERHQQVAQHLEHQRINVAFRQREATALAEWLSA